MMEKTTSEKPLMQANCSEIVVLNFRIDPKILLPRVPRGLELDYHDDQTFVSLVVRSLKKVKMARFPIPVSQGFEELNLRFYVKRQDGPREVKGTCIIKEYVPSAISSWILSTLFKTTVGRMEMSGQASGFGSKKRGVVPKIHYKWKVGEFENKIKIKGRALMSKTGPETQVGFILNHKHEFGVRDSKTVQYRIQSPPWTVWDAAHANFECDTRNLFGQEFAKPLSRRPSSVFLAEGNPMTVFQPTPVS